MKRIISLFIAIAMVAVMLPSLGLLISAEGSELTEQPTRDTSWYDANAAEKKYTITTAAELLGFSDLLATGNHTFEGWTVTLGADIDLNPEWTAGSTAPTNVWADTTYVADIGGTFKGTFNGGLHTVSGIYLKATKGASAEFTGIFGGNVSGGVVQNLSIVNSYVEGGKHLGAIFGACAAGASIKNVYCEAIVKTLVNNGGNAYVGGLIGGVTGGTTPIDNCVFNGAVQAENAKAIAGFVGRLTKAGINFTNSAFYGSVQANGDGVAGLVGTMESGANSKLSAEDCIIAGNISIAEGKIGGSVYGLTNTGNAIGITDLYYTNITENGESKEQGWYKDAVTPSAASTYGHITDDELKSFGASELSEKGLSAWMMYDNGYPLPVQVVYVLRGEDSVIINTAEELLEFASEIENGNDFADKNIVLGADIDLNEGWNAAASAVSAPKKTWTLKSSNKGFAGTFDGKGHTISGIYINNTGGGIGIFGNVENGATATIKNLVITNSYIASSGEYHGGLVGYVAGELNVDGVYVDAVMNNTSTGGDKGVGGFVGIADVSVREANCSVSISNSVFAGSITTGRKGGVSGIGGIIGAVNATDTLKCKIDVEDCGFFGSIKGKGDSEGGIVGIVGNNDVDESGEAIKESLKITLARAIVGGSISIESEYFNGSICGELLTDAKNIAASDCYYIQYNNGTLCNRAVFVDDKTHDGGLEGCTMVSDMDIRGTDTEAWLTEKLLSAWTVTEGYPMPTAIAESLSGITLPGLGDEPNDVFIPIEDDKDNSNGGNKGEDNNNESDNDGKLPDDSETDASDNSSDGGISIEDLKKWLVESGPTVAIVAGVAVVVALVAADVLVAAAVSIPVSVIVVAIDRKRQLRKNADPNADEGSSDNEEQADTEATNDTEA